MLCSALCLRGYHISMVVEHRNLFQDRVLSQKDVIVITEAHGVARDTGSSWKVVNYACD